MSDDVMIAGIGVGGMKDKYEIKILICYLLNNFKKPLTKDEINYIFQDEQIVNYFDFSEAFNELVKSGHIAPLSIDGEERYEIKELGADTAKTLASSLPQSVRDKVITSAMELMSRIKIERENEVIITPSDSGFNVKLVIHDVDFDIMQLELYAPDEIQAERIKENFLKDPLKLYRSVMSNLI